MAQIVPTQNGWIDTDPFGFKQAQDLGMRLRQQANEDAAFKTQQILENQKASAQDIMNQEILSRVARPVDAGGNVTAPAQPTVDRVQTTPQPADQGNAVEDSNTLDQLRNLPAMSMGPPPVGSAAPQQYQSAAPQPGASLSQLLNLPQMQTNYNPGGQQTAGPANPSHVITYSDAQGRKLRYEMKAPQEIQQQAQELEANQGAFQRQQKAMDITSGEMAQSRGALEVRKEMLTPSEQGGLGMGIPIGNELGTAFGLPPDHLVLQSEMPGLQEVADKLQQAKTAATTQGFGLAAQMAGTAQNQQDWDAMRSRLPASVQGAIPQLYSPLSVAMVRKMGVPIGQQPEFDINTAKANAMQALSNQDPASLDAQVDNIVPKTDPMNASTKALIHAAASRPDALTAIPQILKDAYDQRGRVQVAKETKANAVSIDLSSAAGSGTDALAQGIADYRIAPLAGFALARPSGQAVMARVAQLNPKYRAEYYNNFNKTESDATTGKIGTSANAINTAMGHLGVLSNASDALASSNLPALNAIANWAGVQTGQDPVTTYNTIVHRLGPEITKAYLASGGSLGERGTNEADFDPKLSPAQRKANIGASALLFGSKIDALNQQYQRGTYGLGKQQLISPEAEKTRQQLTGLAPGGLSTGTAPGGIQVKTPSGKVHTFPTQAQADAFKKAMGIQ